MTSNTTNAQKRIIDFFNILDKNGDGEVSKVEIISAIRKQHQSEVSSVFQLPNQIRQEDGSRDAFMKIFHEIDTDGDGNVTMPELMKFFEKNPQAFVELSHCGPAESSPPVTSPPFIAKSRPFVAKPFTQSNSPPRPSEPSVASQPVTPPKPPTPVSPASKNVSGGPRTTTGTNSTPPTWGRPPPPSKTTGPAPATPTSSSFSKEPSQPSSSTKQTTQSDVKDIFKLTEEEAVLFFKSLDRNGDGQVSKVEMISAIRSQDDVSTVLNMPSHVRQEDGTRDLFMQVFHDIDTDGSGQISLDEFVSYLKACHVYGGRCNSNPTSQKSGTPDSVATNATTSTKASTNIPAVSARFIDWAFKKIDTDRSGTISKMEIISALRTSQQIADALRLPREVSIKDGSKQRLEALFNAIDTDGSKLIDRKEFMLFFEKRYSQA